MAGVWWYVSIYDTDLQQSECVMNVSHLIFLQSITLGHKRHLSVVSEQNKNVAFR